MRRENRSDGLDLGPEDFYPTPTGRHFIDGRRLLAWLGERDARGTAELAKLLSPDQPLGTVPLLPEEPIDLASLGALGEDLARRLADVPLAARGSS